MQLDGNQASAVEADNFAVPTLPIETDCLLVSASAIKTDLPAFAIETDRVDVPVLSIETGLVVVELALVVGANPFLSSDLTVEADSF